MLGHIRSGTLDKFKDEFDKALSGGEGFSSAACHCSKSYMALFDEECAGMIIFSNDVLSVEQNCFEGLENKNKNRIKR